MVVKIKDSHRLMSICTDIISKTHDWVWEVDGDGFFMFCSEAIEDILGYTPKEYIKKNLFEHLPPLNVEKFNPIIDVKVRFLHKNGSFINTNVNAIPYFDEYNEFQGYRGTSKIIHDDIKNIKFSNTSDHVSQLISENINDLICIIEEKNYRIKYINGKKILKLLGYSNQNLIGQRILDIINPKDHKKLGKLLKRGLSSTKTIKEIQVKKSNHSYIWAEIKSIKYEDKNLVKKILLILRDITPEKEFIQESEDFRNKIRKISKSIPEINYWKLLQPKKEIAGQLFHESEKKYKNMLNHLDVGFFKTDMDGLILNHNHALNKIFGYDLNENLVGVSGSVLWLDKEDLNKRINVLVKKGMSRNFYHNITKKNGERILISVDSHLVYDKNGNPIEIEGIVTDITEKSLLEQKLKESEKKYRTIIENTKDIIVIIGLDGKYIYISPQFSKALGGLEITKEVDLFAFIHPDDRLELVNLFERARTETVNKQDEVEFRIKHQDGHYIWFASMARNYLDDDGNFIGFISSLRDITERKKAERQFQKMIEFSSDLISIMGLDGKILYQSPSCENLLGFTPEEMIGTIAYEYMHPDDRSNVIDTLAEGLRSDLKVGRVECRFKHKDGSWRLIEAIGSNLVKYKGTQGIIINTRDITERMKMQQELKESEKRYRNIIENTADAITIIGLDGKLLFVSPQLSTMLGKTINTDDNFFKHIHPDDIRILKEAYTKIFKEKNINNKEAIEFRLKHVDGHYVWLYSSTKNYLDDDGRIIGFISELRDETYRKIAEQKLKESEEKYRSLINNITDVIVEMDLNGNYLYVSPQSYDIYGYRPEEIIGTNAFETVHPDDLEIAMDSFKNAIKNKQIATLEIRALHKDGSFVHVSSRSTVINVDGEFKIISVNRDISERKKAEQKLRASEEKYRLISENANDIIAIINEKFELEYRNEKVSEKISGYTYEETVGRSSLDRIHPDDIKKAINVFSKGFKDGEAQAELRTYHKDGHIIWLDIKGKTFIDANGQKKGLLLSRDITERKKAEQKLKESEEKYRLISENANDLISIINENFEYEYVNEQTYYRVTGFNKEELIGKVPFALAHPDDKEQAIKSFKNSFKVGEGIASLRFKNKSGSYMWFEIKGRTFIDKNQEKKMLVIARDITKRKEAELQIYEFNKLLEGIIEERTKELKESEERLKKKTEEQALLLDNIETQIWYLKDIGKYGAVNKSYANFLGIDAIDIENKNVIDFQELDQANQCIADNREVFEKKKPFHIEEWARNAEGESRYFSVIKTPKLDEYGIVEYVVCTAEDITKRKRAEDKLRESEIRFRTIAEQSLLGIIIIQDGAIMYSNMAFSSIIGYSIKEIEGWGIHEFQNIFHPEDSSYLINRINLNEDDRGPEIVQIPTRIITKNGRVKWLEVYSKNILYRGRLAIFATMVDISDKRKTEESLKKSEIRLLKQNLELMKLDKLKDDFITIAAHELKTPLISIIGYMELILTRNDIFDPEMKDDLTRVLSNANRLQIYINQLMDVMKIDSKEMSLELNQINTFNLVKDCISEVVFQIERKDLKVDNLIDEKLILNIDSFRMSQVFSNLLSNAIKFSNQHEKIDITVVKGQYYYLFKVRDNGVGLEKKDIQKLFRKFVMINQNTENFNAAERGSGLGLYITKGIVEAHGGKIWVVSKGKDKGTEVNFTLPI